MRLNYTLSNLTFSTNRSVAYSGSHHHAKTPSHQKLQHRQHISSKVLFSNLTMLVTHRPSYGNLLNTAAVEVDTSAILKWVEFNGLDITTSYAPYSGSAAAYPDHGRSSNPGLSQINSGYA